jgi:aspartyl-tRNA(Asn)/glutamyl-tRNA(Gln) amidotransferase subunit A
MEPWQLGAVEAVRLMYEQKLSPVELVQSLLDRIEAIDGELKAWVTIDGDAALATAAARAEGIANGSEHGVVAGLPVGLKDVFLTAGLRTTASSRALADFVPTEDATAVTALRDAGGVVLGKVHTAEFACADPAPTRNPWNAEHTPGGSSSGSAASVAAGTVPVTLGTQTGGSTLRPAAYNGIVGLKPTYGLVSNRGVIPLAWSFDHVGVLARSVADADLVLQAIAGYDPHDPASRPEAAAFRSVDLDGASAPVIGLVRSHFMETSEPDMLEHFLEVAAKFEAEGATVREVDLPASFPRIAATFGAIAWSETASYHRQQFAERGELYGPKIATIIKQGLTELASDYVQAMRERPGVIADLETTLDDVDILLTPTTPSPPPRNTSHTGDATFQIPWAYAGLPSMSLPSGVNRWGLPLGVQLVGHRWRDSELLRSARWCEQVLGFSSHPPCW